MTLIYLPLEPYTDRYTIQLSAPKTGWNERNWIKHRIDYIRIDGGYTDKEGVPPPRTVKGGVVLDPVGRTQWAFGQTLKLLNMAEEGKIKDSDVIYLDDFWHPGFDAIPYVFGQLNIRPRIYSFCHAQSVDRFDFTYNFRKWMRPMEAGIAHCLDGIFVSCPALKEELVLGGVCHRDKVHAVGHVWDTEEVMSRMPDSYRFECGDQSVTDSWILKHPPRKNQVVFASRPDKEKNPDFFIEVARRVKKRRPDTSFIVCTGNRVRSNAEYLLQTITTAVKDGIIGVRAGLSKELYYSILTESKVIFNCADQDWLSYVLLEGSAAGCYPLFPYFRSFPDVLPQEHLYHHKDAEAAANAVIQVLDTDGLWTPEKIWERSWIHTRFDSTFKRILATMGMWHRVESGPPSDRLIEAAVIKDGTWGSGNRTVYEPNPFDRRHWHG